MADAPTHLLPVSQQTYQEIRQLLLAAGKGGTFARYQGREMIDMTGVAIIVQPAPLAGPQD
jgi:hypothetical protein